MRGQGMLVGMVVGLAVVHTVRAARADEAVVVVQPPEEREVARVVERADDRWEARDERARSGARLSLGGAAGAVERSGTHGMAGLDLGLSLGSGVIGARLGAAWLRAGDDAPGLAQYGAEITVDAIPRGALHPIAGVGIALAHASGANAGMGTMRVGVEYALPVRDADVRAGIALLGALPGPADAELADLRAYAMGVASLSVGF